MNRIYVLDGDEPYRQALVSVIEQRCVHKVSTFATPHEFFYEVGKLPPQCVVVDWQLPEMSGLDVVRRVRKLMGPKIGVVMALSQSIEEHVVGAFEAGADDCFVRPTAAKLIVARLDALLRRVCPIQGPLATVELGPYEFDYHRQSVSIDGEPIDLTPREFDLAWTFFESPSRLFTKQELLASLWGKHGSAGMHTIAQHVYSIRKKLAMAAHGFQLTSAYAAGYRMEPPADESARTTLTLNELGSSPSFDAMTRDVQRCSALVSSPTAA